MNSVLADEKLQLLKNISAAGAPVLTLKMLDQAQPGLDADLYQWILWEQERLSILAQWQQWDEMLLRIENYPDDIPDQFRHQATTYKIGAYLELGQAATARKILRGILWQETASESSEYERWRQQIIVSYIRDGMNENARIAMLRFDQDFDNAEIDWLMLRATVLIKSARQQQAIRVLEANDQWPATLTSKLASFQINQLGAAEIWKYVKKRSEAESFESGELATLWALGYKASMKMAPVDRVVALELLFKIGSESPLELFAVPVDALWRAYLDYAELVGNRAELLLGDDQSWINLAQKAALITPIKSRSLYAMVLRHSPDKAVIEQAAQGYLKTFSDIDVNEQHLLDALFLNSAAYSTVESIPASIRYQLVDQALKAADIKQATRLMSGLDTIPETMKKFDWQLRQSRVLILGGRYDEGNRVLVELLQDYREADAVSTDRILQVLFDLQTVNYHQQAIAHFNRLLTLEIESKQRREILFWIADSFRDIEEFDTAALLYLQSAMLPGASSLDPWAQTARFNAAENLEKAGMVDDARRIYLGLLKVTEEPARRSVLNHKIQQLWLNQSSE